MFQHEFCVKNSQVKLWVILQKLPAHGLGSNLINLPNL